MVMPLVPSYNTKRVYGTWVRQGGAELRPGTYKVTVPVRITNASDDVIIPAGVYSSGTLNTTPGAPSLDILAPCTDDADNFPSSGWQLLIDIVFTDAPPEKYALDVSVNGSGVNLRGVVLAASFPTPLPVLTIGIAGGLALLDSDGDVVDADGVKVGGGAVVGGSTRSVTASTTAEPGELLLINTAGGALTITLPDPTPEQAKIELVIVGNSSNTVTVVALGGTLINYGTSGTLNIPGLGVSFVTDGTDYFTIGL